MWFQRFSMCLHNLKYSVGAEWCEISYTIQYTVVHKIRVKQFLCNQVMLRHNNNLKIDKKLQFIRNGYMSHTDDFVLQS